MSSHHRTAAPATDWDAPAPWLALLCAQPDDFQREVTALRRLLSGPETMARVMASPRASGLAVLAANRLAARLAEKPVLSSTGRVTRLEQALAAASENATADIRGAMEVLSAGIRRRVKHERLPQVSSVWPPQSAPIEEVYWKALSGLATSDRTLPLAASLLLDAYLHPPLWALGGTPLLPAQEFFMEVDAILHKDRVPVDWGHPPLVSTPPATLARVQADWLLALGLGFAATNYWISPLAPAATDYSRGMVAWLRLPAWDGFMQEAVDMAWKDAPRFASIVREMPQDLSLDASRMERFEYVLATATATLHHRSLAAPRGSARRRHRA